MGDVRDQLRDIVEELGDIYLNMAENYPLYFERLDGEFENLQCLDDEDRDSSLFGTSRRIGELLRTKDGLVEKKRAREAELFGLIDGELVKLAGVEGEIDGIENCSQDLELISLNAMVSALKAGNHGGAFPYITRELQRVSRLSAENSSHIRQRGDFLDKRYKSFIEDIRNSQKRADKEVDLLFSSLGDIVESLREKGGEFSLRCQSFRKAMEQIRKPLRKIIEEVQKQDIVRQSIDHIILSLDEIDSRKGGNEKDLDYLKFSFQVYELSRFIIEDIRLSVLDSFERFSREKREVEGMIDQISRVAKETFLTHDKSDDLVRRLDSLEAFRGDSALKETGSSRSWSSLELEGMIEDLEDGINRFSKLLNTIRNIHVSSRIEVVKLNHLENMDNIIISIDETVGEMEGLLGNITDSVSDFKKASVEISGEFESYTLQVDRDLRGILGELTPLISSLNLYESTLKGNVERFVKVTEDFNHFSQLVASHLGQMERLISRIDGISAFFNKKREEQNRLFLDLLEKSGREHWELTGDGIKQLIDKFTIFIHKKKLTQDNDPTLFEEDDEQASASEITLF